MSLKTVSIIGATGLIGQHLLHLLQEDKEVETIRILVRKPVHSNHPKTQMKLIDFSDTESFKLGIDGSDAVFCAVGTTQKKVQGDRDAYRKVDFDIPVKAARFCRETHCFRFLVVSSVGASPAAKNFYLKLKGEMETAVKGIGVPSTSVFRPSMLLGERKENRTGERLGQKGMKLFSFLLAGSLQKYKPIEAEDVAAAMISAAHNGMMGFHIYEYEGIESLKADL